MRLGGLSVIAVRVASAPDAVVDRINPAVEKRSVGATAPFVASFVMT
jgi:hypothetical protein